MEVSVMLQEITYTIKPDKANEFFDKLYKTAPSKSDWERIKRGRGLGIICWISRK